MAPLGSPPPGRRPSWVGTTAADADLEALSSVARTLEPVQPCERKAVMRDEAEEESWERVGLVVAPAAREKLGEALALAGKVLGATAPTWQRIEAICQEYLGAHPPRVADDEQVASRLLGHARSGQDLEELKAWLEKEHQRWEFLTQFDPAPLQEPLLASAEQAGGETASAPSVDLARLDADLRRLRELRSRWDDLLGHLALILRQLGLWRDMRFVSIEHYFTERLGMSDRTVGQRIALERRLYDLPPLRDAMRSGRVTYEKARIVAAHATERTLEAWLQRAERNTVQKRVLARDRDRCQVPGCSRAALQAHHVKFRSHLGGDAEENLTGICAAHHLHGIHAGYLRVTGVAPHRLRWSFPPGGGPLSLTGRAPASGGALGTR